MNLGAGIINNSKIKSRLTQLGFKEFLTVFLCFCALLLIELCVGEVYNINLLVLFTYSVFLILIYIRDIKFFVEFFWVIILFTLNIVGVYICDEGCNLTELQVYSYYCGALAPLVFSYILFFGVVELYRLKKKKIDEEYHLSISESKLLQFLVILGFVIEIYLLSQVITHPYFIVGELRLGYAQQYMSSFAVSLRTYLPMFIPIFLLLWKSGKRIVPILFFFLMLIFYFCEGDKFGTYLFAAYIMTLCIVQSISIEAQKKVIKAVFLLFCILILVVYIQRVLIFSSDTNAVLQYLFERLSQQGEVWWSVYSQTKTSPLNIDEFGDELYILFANMPISNYSDYGQWKMMSVAAHYSSNSQYRILIGNPYTATTTATVFYYFKWAGLVLFYIIAPAIYAAVISNAMKAFSVGWILESMIYVKLISILNTVLTASNIESLVSFAGIFYIFALVCLTLLRQIGKLNYSKKPQIKTKNGV